MPKPCGASGAERPAALVLSPEAPYPVVGGGPMRTACLLEYLRGRYAVEVVTFREPGAPDPASLFPADMRVHVIDLPFHSRSAPARAVRNAVRYARGVPPLIDRFSGFERQAEAAIAGRRFELGMIEHFWCGSYLPVFRRACKRVGIDLHNIESVLLERCAAADGGVRGAMFRRWARRCRVLEAAALPQFDHVLTTSEADAALLPVRSFVVPNTIPFRPVPPSDVKRPEIVFAGNLEYQPNQTAVRWFARDIWPRLRERVPGLQWRLVGRNEHAVRRLVSGDSRVVLSGAVDDAVEEMAPAQAAVVPLLSGSGTRIKIIEAWAACLPVVSTGIGAEGLPATDGEHLLIADSADDFVLATVRILEDAALHRKLAAAGRKLYEEKLTWNAAWNILNHTGL